MLSHITPGTLCGLVFDIGSWFLVQLLQWKCSMCLSCFKVLPEKTLRTCPDDLKSFESHLLVVLECCSQTQHTCVWNRAAAEIPGTDLRRSHMIRSGDSCRDRNETQQQQSCRRQTWGRHKPRSFKLLFFFSDAPLTPMHVKTPEGVADPFGFICSSLLSSQLFNRISDSVPRRSAKEE